MIVKSHLRPHGWGLVSQEMSSAINIAFKSDVHDITNFSYGIDILFYDDALLGKVYATDWNKHFRVTTGQHKDSVGKIIGFKTNNQMSLVLEFKDNKKLTMISKSLNETDDELTDKIIKSDALEYINYLGQSIKKDTLVLVFNPYTKKQVYGKVIKLTPHQVWYIEPCGKETRTGNIDSMYVPDDQNEFSFEYTLEAIKS